MEPQSTERKSRDRSAIESAYNEHMISVRWYMQMEEAKMGITTFEQLSYRARSAAREAKELKDKKKVIDATKIAFMAYEGLVERYRSDGHESFLTREKPDKMLKSLSELYETATEFEKYGFTTERRKAAVQLAKALVKKADFEWSDYVIANEHLNLAAKCLTETGIMDREHKAEMAKIQEAVNKMQSVSAETHKRVKSLKEMFENDPKYKKY